MGMRYWTEVEVEELRQLYGADPSKPFEGGLLAFARKHSRHPANVVRKARSLGLPVNQCRKKLHDPKGPRQRKTSDDDDLRALQSRLAKKRIAENGHPRGFHGRSHSKEARSKISDRARAAWSNPRSGLRGEHEAQRRSDLMVERTVKRMNPRGYNRGAGGAREDLAGLYVRSSWEANYARYLNLLLSQKVISSWEYEPHTFVFEGIKRGCRTYTPDFRVDFPDGRREWHEVKGWMDQKSRTRLDRMGRYYPGEVVVVIDKKWFKQARKSGLAGSLPFWEGG